MEKLAASGLGGPAGRRRTVTAAVLWLLAAGCGTGVFYNPGGDAGNPGRDAWWPPDAWITDAGATDAADLDAALPDGWIPDAALPDAAIPDAAPPDAQVTCNLPAAGSHNLTINVDGTLRSYILYVPAGLSAPSPLVIALHGNGDQAANFLAYSQLGSLADAQGFLLAVPQAVSGSAPYGVDWDAYTEPPSSNADYRFVEEVREAWSQCADPSRLYVLGYSQGGFLAFYVGMKDAAVLAAIHVQSAASPGNPALINNAARAIPVQIRIGTNDSLLSVAQQTRDALLAAGHVVDYQEIAGHGHCCYLSSLNPEIWSFFAAHPL